MGATRPLCGEPFFHAGSAEGVEAVEESEGLVEELGTNLGQSVRDARGGMAKYIPSIPALSQDLPTRNFELETSGFGKVPSRSKQR